MPQLNVKNVDPATLDRLTAQAQAAGVSVSEWVRGLLDLHAGLYTADELEAMRSRNADLALSEHAGAAWYHARLHSGRPRRTA